MKRELKAALFCILYCAVLATSPAKAAFIFDITQNGPNVVIEGNGSINTAALTLHSQGSAAPYLYPRLAVLVCGSSSTNSFAIYQGSSGPASIGPGANTFNPTGFGDVVGTSGGNIIDLPNNYVSGSPLSVTDSISNQTFASVGLVPGTYVDTWGSGSTYDSLTINIGVVPEPASLAVFGVPAAFALFLRRRGLR